MTPLNQKPARFELEGIFFRAKSQKLGVSPAFYKNSKRREFISANLTAEQRHLYDFIAFLYVLMGLPRRAFAKQAGVSLQTLDLWLARRGVFPSGGALSRLLDLYEVNVRNDKAIKTARG